MTQKDLENIIKHYIDSKDYKSARNYVENFADDIKSFNKSKALKEIDNAENGIQKPVKEEKEEVKEE